MLTLQEMEAYSRDRQQRFMQEAEHAHLVKLAQQNKAKNGHPNSLQRVGMFLTNLFTSQPRTRIPNSGLEECVQVSC
jgi:hypothetical protein